MDKFALNLFVDGLPLHYSGPTQLWPIMAQIHELPEVPFLVLGIFCGSSKPDNVEDYLCQLVDDLNHVMDQGVTINKTKIGIDLRVMIADSLARAFIKGKLIKENCIYLICIVYY